eukprot:UN00443
MLRIKTSKTANKTKHVKQQPKQKKIKKVKRATTKPIQRTMSTSKVLYNHTPKVSSMYTAPSMVYKQFNNNNTILNTPRQSFMTTKKLFNEQPITPPPSPQPEQQVDMTTTLTLPCVLRDLQLEALIPTMQSPPELPSLFQYQAHTGQIIEEVSLYHLTLLSTQDFRTLVPNDINRNRLKDHLRHLIHQPLVSDGAEPITLEQFNAVLSKLTRHDDHANTTTTTTQTATTTTEQQKNEETSSQQQDNNNNTTTTTTSESNTSSSEVIAPTTEQKDSLLSAEKELAHATLKSSMTALKMPTFFDSMNEGTILEWHVKVGQHFNRGDVLCDIDTDIAELSFEAPEPGHLSEILVHAGEKAPVGQPMAIMKYEEDETKL